ncbi:MAG: nucleotidyltransferase domain-containing protein [Ktedonobacterales bacterium]
MPLIWLSRHRPRRNENRGNNAMIAQHASLPALPLPRVHDPDSRAAVFVRACGHAELDSPALTALHQLGAQLGASEWNEVQGYALVERMECLTYTHAAAAGLLPSMPEPIRTTFADVYRGTLTTNLLLRNTTLNLVTTLQSHGIRTVCVKGVALALSAYRDIAHRPMGDIDLLIERSAAPAVESLMRELGYHAVLGMDRPLSFASLRNRALVFERKGGAMVEFHWSLSGMPPYAQRFVATNVWRRIQPMHIKDSIVWRLHPYDELRYLCFHYAVQHQAQRLLWLVDIAELLTSASYDAGAETPWDWAEFTAETIALDLALPVALALVRARDLLGTVVPEDILLQLSHAAQSRPERAGWRAALASPNSPASLLRYLLALDTSSQRLAFLGGALRHVPRIWARRGYRTVRRTLHRA